MKNETSKENKKTAFKGIVVSDATDKTIIVEVETLKTHSKYHKQYRSTKRFAVHDEANSAKEGQVVEFVQCKPFSKRKRFMLAK